LRIRFLDNGIHACVCFVSSYARVQQNSFQKTEKRASRKPEPSESYFFAKGKSMQSEIDRFFSENVQLLVRSLQDLDSRIPANAAPVRDDLLEELTAAINASLAACARLESRFLENGNSPAGLKEVQARYREAIWPWISKSWCMNRSIAKPRGYPGDYQLLTVIYNRKPVSTGIGGYLDRYWQNLTLARAVVGRMVALRRFLVEELS